MRAIAMYLPQFHQISENDEWWGEGFTDWVTVRNATKRIEGQCQPRKPYNDNYYDLMNKETMVWQAELMHKYGIDGICIYHYWFKDGRQVLQKPVENLLKWKDIDMPFCFSWANETWARSWSNIRSKNVWTDLYENMEKQGNENGILMEQAYGGKDQWEKHFEYLLPYFRDKRYICHDGKPVFMIYHARHISCLREMLNCWRKKAKEAGLPGIYVIGRIKDYYMEQYLDALFIQEPQESFGRIIEKHNMPRHGLRIFNYDEMWETALDRKINKNMPVYYGGFCDYDDSPRRGSEGQIVIGASAKKFSIYLSKLMAKNEASGSFITFINAWNEWGESMYLEPDSDSKYDYLEAVRSSKHEYKEHINEFTDVQEIKADNINKLHTQNERRYRYMRILDKWMALYEADRDFLVKWMKKKDLNQIAIYGMGMLGRHLEKQLEESGIQVRYAIDRNGTEDSSGLYIYTIDQELPNVDIIIVTVFYDYERILKELSKRGMRSVSLENVIMDEF